jgi:DNA-binding transcriptional MerR regulator
MHLVRKTEPTLGPAGAARRMGISVKTLRHYEKRGLLSPKRARNGWRVYEPDQLERLEQILAFKAMGFGLSEIASLLGAAPEALAGALAAQELSLEARIRRLRDELDAVRDARGRPADGRLRALAA